MKTIRDNELVATAQDIQHLMTAMRELSLVRVGFNYKMGRKSFHTLGSIEDCITAHLDILSDHYENL